jgi:hypothetical protein
MMQSSISGNKHRNKPATSAGSSNMSQRSCSLQRSNTNRTPVSATNKNSSSADSSLSSVQQQSSASSQNSKIIWKKRLAIKDSDDNSNEQGNVIHTEKRSENANASLSALLSDFSKQLELSSLKKQRHSLTHHKTPVE